jgi:hypothetical protein
VRKAIGQPVRDLCRNLLRLELSMRQQIVPIGMEGMADQHPLAEQKEVVGVPPVAEAESEVAGEAMTISQNPGISFLFIFNYTA